MSVFGKIGNFFSDAATTVVNGAKELGNAVANGVKEVFSSAPKQPAPAAKAKGASVFQQQQQAAPKKENLIAVELGNGETKYMDQTGNLVKVVIDCSKNVTPSFWPADTKIEYINAPKPKEKSFWDKVDDALTSVDNFVNRASGGYVKKFGHGMAGWAVPVTGAVAAATAPVATGVAVTGIAMASCSTDNVINRDFQETTITQTGTIPGESVKPAALTPEEWTNAKVGLLNSTVEAKNNENPKTSDGVGYKYVVGNDGNGAVVIKNKDGSDSNIKLGFTSNFEVSGESTDPVTGNYSAGLTLTATPNGTVTTSNVVEYINIIGGKPKTSAGDEFSFSMQNGNVVTKYGDTGFTHIVGQSATVTANSPLGKTQKMLTDIGLLPEMNGKIATHEKTSTGAYAGNGISFEVVPGDLKEVTTGNPRVKMSFNAIKNHQLNIEGKLSVGANGVVTITADDGTKVTLTKKSVVDIAGDNYNNGISVAVNGRETYRLASDAGRIEMAYVEDNGSTDTTTNFKPNAPKVFDGKSATKESDAYFDEKRINLETAYKEAVGSIYNQAKLEKDGTPGTNYTVQITVHTEAGTEVIVTTK